MRSIRRLLRRRSREGPLPARGAFDALPPELHWQSDESIWHATRILLGRRQLLKVLVAMVAVLVAPLGRAKRAAAVSRGGFFTRAELVALEALCDEIIPPDHDPGASELGAPAYIEGLLTAFETSGPPHIFAGGPFSDRNPFPDDETGTPSRRFPKNSLAKFLPLSRLEEIEWRAQVYGSAAAGLPKFIDDQLGGPLLGLRDLYRGGLAKVDQVSIAVAGASFGALSGDDRARVFRMLDDGAFKPDPRRGGSTFIDIVIQHTLEGCFALPEYGGNDGSRGWQMLGIEGDNQPLGFSVFSRAQGDYNERADHPMTTPNPDEVGANGSLVPHPLTADGTKIEQAIVTLTQALGEDCG